MLTVIMILSWLAMKNAIIDFANTHHVFKTPLLSHDAPAACHCHAAEGQVSTLRLGGAGSVG